VKWFKRKCTSFRMMFLSVSIFESVFLVPILYSHKRTYMSVAAGVTEVGGRTLWNCKVTLSRLLFLYPARVRLKPAGLQSYLLSCSISLPHFSM
jgi:hypothetical protein